MSSILINAAKGLDCRVQDERSALLQNGEGFIRILKTPEIKNLISL